MKKKQIEAIPFQERVEIPEEYKYLAAVSIQKFDTKTLMVDIFERKGPICRIAITKNDYATYMVKDKRWSSATINSESIYGVIWDTSHSAYNVTKETDISETDLQKIKDFTKNNYNWVTNIEHYQRSIKADKESTREENWKNKLAKRMEETPAHSVEFLAWAKSQISEKYLYYLRKGNYAYVTCSHCGQREKYYTGNATTYEQQFIKKIEIPKRGKFARCLKCGALAVYKCEGQTERSYSKIASVYDVQKLENGVCISLVEVKKTFRIGYEEEYQFKDKAKFWYYKGRKAPETAYNHGPYERTRWEKQSTEWGEKIEAGDYPVFLLPSQLKGTCLQYSGFEFYRKDIVKYMNTYLKHPELELLSKLKFTHIVERMLKGAAVLNMAGKKLADKLMIWPNRVEQLQKKKGKDIYWKLYKIERRNGHHFSEEFCKELLKLSYFRLDAAETVLKYISPQKCESYMNKVGWNNLETYRDYLTMRDDQGYDMTDSIILFPRDLRIQHDRMVLEKNKADREKRITEKNKAYPEIEKMYPELKKTYAYQDDTFMIRPAKNAGELITESALLHHCVGTSDIYMSDHQRKSAYIMFLRKVKEPDTAYCTIEMTPDGKIKQWQQEYNKKPDRELIEPWLQQYTKQLKEKLC